MGIAAFAETDVTADMNKIDVPTLILHGDDDQIAPVGNATLAAAGTARPRDRLPDP